MSTVLSVCRLLPRQQWIQGRYKNCSHVTLCMKLFRFSAAENPSLNVGKAANAKA
ncbi:hypothetical protein BH10PSE11_BH10PSE11_01550 [soil metagenome]